jgi:site-specific recombinase XerD
MLENYFRDAPVLSRLRNGPMAPHRPHLIRAMEEQQFKHRIIRRAIRRVDSLGCWLEQQGVPLAEADESHVRTFVMQRSRTSIGRLVASGMTRIVPILQQQGILNAPEPRTEAGCWLQRFDEHLARVHGVCAKARSNYVRYARRFLALRPGGARPPWASLGADEIQASLQSEMEKMQPGPGRRQPMTAMPAMIGFLATEGSLSPNLAMAIPAMRDWQHATLPRYFTPEQLDGVLAVCRAHATISLHDRAIVLLLARLGMRSGEVRQLRLEDVDWTEGTIHIRLGKARHERVLPLPDDVGAALVAYLRRERPPSSCRTIFLRSCAPHTTLSSIARIVKHVLQQAGIAGPGVGAYHLRHTVATHLVRQGVPFKEVADILGHRSIETTGIYAKLDVPSLAGIALPWPGGVQ